MKIIFFNYTGDRDNWGCQATSRALLQLISLRYPEAEIVRFQLDPIEAWFRPFANLTFPLMSWIMRKRDPQRLSSFERWLVRFFGNALYGARVKDIEEADISLLQAEGTMFLYRGKTVRLFFGPYLSLVFGVKKVVSTNQTIHSEDRRLDELIKAVFSRMDFVAVREPASLRKLHSLGIGKAILAPDAAFRTQPHDVTNILEKLNVKDGFIALGGSAQIDGRKSYYLDIIRELNKYGEREFVFFAPTQDDRELGYSIAESAPVRLVDFSKYTLNEVCGLLGHASILVSGRFHLNILSSCTGTPIVFLGTNTHKNHGLIEMMGLPFPLRDVADPVEVSRAAGEILAREVELRPMLSSRVAELAAFAEKGVSWG